MTEWLIKTQYDANEGRWISLATIIINKWYSRHNERDVDLVDPSEYAEEMTIERLLNTMYLIDFEAYRELGYSLTGVAWQKGNEDYPDTPVPKDLAHYLEVLEGMGYYEKGTD